MLSALEIKLNPRLKQKVLDEIKEFIFKVLDPETGKLLNYRQLIQHPKLKDDWSLSSANEFRRLAQGVGGRIEGTNTIFFIDKKDVLTDR